MRKLHCPDCGSKNLIQDEKNGCLICENCEATLNFCGKCGDLCNDPELSWSDLGCALVCDSCWEKIRRGIK